MIFIGLFLFIVFIVMALNMYDNSNLEKIENYITEKKCSNYIYTKGSYKALCKDELLEIPNSFSLDIKKDKLEYKYKDIQSIEKEDKNILINDKDKISFSKTKETDIFYMQLEEKLNKQD
ncbi:hypothetical protein [Poseidonibacter ostreae]|uniref:Uncharacterized protein n=1 Tax=Poseidonibacter ostreae TaxID=2654171 RepID=A0A6L4WRL8_9BACT|nr:hypothetical protein [Poseidonibacter ostreae]KAB7886721.1 hypothetical protein GA417_04980 [Poseidonibacter ostreae]KAB7888191.1 hypothetical protein GBG19_09525 [Poseidonibacter ostreae]KAB7892033.1 hypothetical protein GBG18_04570 [Poseidonibacter ostreae]MAC83509.1 hypothetical protein [Arcobacter sp.]